MKISIKKIALLIISVALVSACHGNANKASSVEGKNINTNHNPYNCQNHQLTETVVKKATIIEKGVMNYKCPNCKCDINDEYYDLDEFVFDDITYMLDNQEHAITIDGLLPYGVTVKYENNTRKALGTQEAIAKFFDEKNNQILEKKAKISIVENVGLPNVRVVTADGDDPDWHTQSDGSRLYESMTVSIDNCPAEYVKSNLPGEIKVRGNSTNQESVAKRAFRLKLSGKTNLLGLNDGLKEKSWVLLADFFDQSKFRNSSAFSMGNDLFNYSGYYSSDYQHVILYMNGENRGVYLLAEQQQAKSGRVPINEAEEGVTSTKVGYLVEIDGLVSQQGNINRQTGLGVLEGDPCFNVENSGRVNNVNIGSKGYVVKTDCFSDEQKLFIRKYMNNASKAFADVCNGTLEVVDENGEIKDSPYTTAYETLNSFMDLDSFFRMYLLQEFLKDYDVGWGSFYMYIDFSNMSTVKRLTMSAPWDFDLAEGNKQSGGMGGGMGGWGGWGGQGGGQQSNSDTTIPSSGISSTKDRFLNNSEYINGMTTFNPWLYMLSQTDFFETMFPKYYSVFDKSGVYDKLISQITYECVAFADVFEDNHTRYGKGASGATSMQTRQYNSQKEAADYLVKWLQERKAYLDETWLLASNPADN